MDIKIGDSYLQHFTVSENQTAKFLGSGNLNVFATPAMIACMENTALILLQKYLPQGFDSVGTEINVKHLKGSLPDEVIEFEAKISQVEEKKVYFEINAFNAGKVCIGSAFHVRYIVDTEMFMSKLLK